MLHLILIISMLCCQIAHGNQSKLIKPDSASWPSFPGTPADSVIKKHEDTAYILAAAANKLEQLHREQPKPKPQRPATLIIPHRRAWPSLPSSPTTTESTPCVFSAHKPDPAASLRAGFEVLAALQALCAH